MMLKFLYGLEFIVIYKFFIVAFIIIIFDESHAKFLMCQCSVLVHQMKDMVQKQGHACSNKHAFQSLWTVHVHTCLDFNLKSSF